MLPSRIREQRNRGKWDGDLVKMQGLMNLLEASITRKSKTILIVRGESGFNGFLKLMQFEGPSFKIRIQDKVQKDHTKYTFIKAHKASTTTKI